MAGAAILLAAGYGPADASATDPTITETAIAEAASANNAFGLDLYRRLAAAEEESNLFLSPFSVASALGMAALGARGPTADEMLRVLHRTQSTGDPCSGLAVLHQMLSTSRDTAGVARTKAEIESLRAEQRALTARTRGELSRVTDWEALRDEENRLVARINELLAGLDPTDLVIANALWGERTCRFRREYVDTVGDCFGAGALQPANFLHAPDAERIRINEWVAEVTRRRIRDLLPAGTVDPSTRLVLTNAIYFKGEWEKPFDLEETKAEAFHLSSGVETEARLMRHRRAVTVDYGAFEADGSFFETPAELPFGDKTAPRYPRDGGFAMVELPYAGGTLSMIVLAPIRPDGLGRIEAELDAQHLSEWAGRLRPREVDVYLPRFRLETEYGLNETLAALGMPRVFRPPGPGGGADFSGMADGLYISLVQHKAFVEVNEEGTEAAAATAGVVASEVSLSATEPFTPTFRADRPFFFAIRDRQSGALLFVGRVMRPPNGDDPR
jgi:serine protease inhibitor